MIPSGDRRYRWALLQYQGQRPSYSSSRCRGRPCFFRVFTHVPSVNIYIYYILYVTCTYIYTHYYCIYIYCNMNIIILYIYGYPKIWWFMIIVPIEIVIGHHMRGSPWIPWPARHWAVLWRRQSLQCERPRLQGVVPICASPYSACFIFA